MKSGGSWTTVETVSTESSGNSNSPSLAVDSDETVHIAWHDDTHYNSSGNDLDIFYKNIRIDHLLVFGSLPRLFLQRVIFIPSFLL